jgi:tetratricopeptide (TPR) repeat protein
MTAERWRQLQSILDRLEATPAEGRAALIDELCRDDAELRAHLEPVLCENPNATAQFIHDAIGAQAASLSASQDEAEAERLAGERFGRYRIGRRIGAGGMGAVYEATRVDDFHKKAALKIIQQEFDSTFARERFQQERQLLAALEHPYIARLIDGGESADGRPYLILEFVEGEPLNQYAERLDRAGCLRLFLKVCEAVGYAHRNLVIHRDLKPANVLVTPNGDPKLLDFGIAKLLQPGAMKTQTGFATLTPDYASPEQVRGLPISTASDVYSLGVMLYQLLTGRKPYTLASTSPVEMDRIVCQEAPPPPGLGDELDHIILMAMRKEPERRYSGVPQLAEDIRRYLDQRPVSARPDTLRYRTGKFVRRNKVALAAAAAVFLALAAGLGAALYEGRLANARFNDVRSLATTFLFEFDKELAAVPGNTKARQLLVATASRNLDKLAATAGNDAGLLAELATAYEKLGDVQGMPGTSNLGLSREAADSYRKAIGILERLSRKYPRYRPQLVVDLSRSGRIAGELFQTDDALRTAARAAQLSDDMRAESPGNMDLVRAAGRSYDLLSTMQRGIYLAEDALQSSRRAVALYEQTVPPGTPPKAQHHLALALDRLASAQRDLGRLEEAVATADRVLAIENAILATDPGDIRAQNLVAGIYQDLAVISDSWRYPNRDDPVAAITHGGDAERIFARLAEEDPNDHRAQVMVAEVRAHLALTYLHRNAAGDIRIADQFSERAAAGIQEALRRSPRSGLAQFRWPMVAWARAMALARLGRSAEAIELSRRALEAERQVTSQFHTWDSSLDLAGQLLEHSQVLVLCGQADAVHPALAEAAALFTRIDGDTRRWMSGAYQAGTYHFLLARTMESVKQPGEAAAHFSEAVRFWSPWQSGNPHVQQRVTAAIAARDRCRE